MALVELGRYFNSFDAGLDKGRLDAAGIMSFMLDTQMNWEGMGGVIQIRLMVDDQDFEEARAVLADQGK